ncbi:MAG: CRTAC1 family protein [Planctomycetes bacterium]|nr:CRTAC1 family protein [Planctomycetota bacterium]
MFRAFPSIGLVVALCIWTSSLSAQTGPQFVNVNAASGLSVPAAAGSTYRGAAWADFDGDLDIDLFAPGGATQPIRLWVNQGNGTFVSQVVLHNPSQSRSDQGCVAADFDNDGDQDVFLCQTGSRACMLFVNDGSGNFTEEASARGVAWVGYSMAATFGDYDRDGYLDLFLSEWNFNAATHVLFRNNGDGTFADVTAQAGVGASGASYAAVFCDVDEDGWPDIFATRDNTGNNLIYRNNGNGTFTDVAPQLGAADTLASMSVTIGDIHNDGDWDYFITNINDHQLLVWDGTTGAFEQSGGTLWGVAQNYGLIGCWAWGGLFFDYDNDGNLDLFYNCLSFFHPYNTLFRGHGNTTPFTDVSVVTGITTALPPSHGLAIVDYDDDGDLDIFNTTGTGVGAQLAANPGFGGNWLKLRLRGTISNRDAIGAVVIAKSASGVRRRMVTSGEGFLCESDRRVHFGLGSDPLVNELEVRWPGGSVTYLPNVAVNQILDVVEPSFTVAGTLTPGSQNLLQFQFPHEVGQFYGVGFSELTFPAIPLPDGRALNVPFADPLLNLTIQPGNPWFGPSSGMVPPSGNVAALFNLPAGVSLSGRGAFAIAFTVDLAYPGSVKSILGPQYVRVP